MQKFRATTTQSYNKPTTNLGGSNLAKCEAVPQTQGNAQANSFAHCCEVIRGNGQIAYHAIFTRNLEPGGFRTASNPYKNSFWPVNQATTSIPHLLVRDT